MKKLIKTVFITTPEAMTLDGDSLVVTLDDKEIGRGFLRNIEAICYYGYKPVRPALMEACVKHDVRLNILHPDGQFISSIVGATFESSLIRRKQYQAAVDPQMNMEIARNMIMAKAFNSRWLFGLMFRDYESYLDKKFIKDKTETLKKILGDAIASKDIETLREVRKAANRELYSGFNDLIIHQKEVFTFRGRSSKPPFDPVNALMSFAYEMLEEVCTAALESAGLDSCAGFFHKEKPGQSSLVLDLMEEFKACMSDKLVLMLINKEIIGKDAFEEVAEGDFALTENGIGTVWEYWHESNRNTTMHPYLEEYVEWGLIPHASALLLRKFLLGEIDKYPPFLRKKPGL